MTDTVSILAEAFKDHQLGAAAPGTSLFEFMAKRLAAASPQGEGSSADADTHRAAEGAVVDVATWFPLDDNGLAEVRLNGKRITSMPSYAGAEEVAERINQALVITADFREAITTPPAEPDWITHDGGPNPVPCGETNPANRCVGCLHLFSVTEGVKP